MHTLVKFLDLYLFSAQFSTKTVQRRAVSVMTGKFAPLATLFGI
jgi:hypothetical protein